VASQSILILCLDSFGDLTLRQPLFRSLLDAGHRVGVAVRTPHQTLLPFLDSRLEPVSTDLNPYQAPDPSFWARAAQLQERIAAFSPDLLVCGLYNRTFLDQWLLRCSAAPTLGFANPHLTDAELDALAPASPRRDASALQRVVSVAEDAPEADRNRALLEALQGAGAGAGDYHPRLQLRDEDETRARGTLERLSLEPGRYAFGAPAGIVNNALKAWRPEAFLDVAGHLEKNHGLAMLVTGVASEEEGLDALIRRGEERGLRLRRWIGAPDDVGELLGLIRLSRLYVGSDTGPMHFAAALDVPVLALFGGGHWPRFLPVARRSFVATRELPCFGCGWECWLPEAACVTTVETRVLVEGADWLLREDAPGRRVDTGTPLAADSLEMVRDGAARYRHIWGRVVAVERYNKMLEGYRDFLLDQKRQLEDERTALKTHLDTQRRHYEESLQASEVEKARRLRTIVQQEALIASLGGQINRLSTVRGALRVLSAKAMRKAGIFEVLRRGRERAKARRRRVGGKPAPAPPPVEDKSQTPSTRLLDGFVLARSLPGELPDLALEQLYRLGATLPAVACVHTTPRNLQAAVMLASGGARVAWLGDADALAGLEVAGLEAPARDLGSFLGASTPPALAPGTALLLDAEGGEEALRLLRYRLAPATTLLVTGGGSRAAWAESLPAAADEAEGLSVHTTPPEIWLDPAGEVPQLLPSGRPWPRISVVTVTLNQGRFLEQTLRSVLGQGYPDLEYIVRDGGSTDGTQEILDRYRSRLTHCISEKDEGQADALNKGFSLATGQILAWLNSDDRYPPGALWRAALAFDSYEADVVVGGCRLVRGDADETVHVHHAALPFGRVTPLPLDRILDLDGSWLKGDFFFQPEVFWTRDIWERSGGGVAKELFYSMDYELWARMAHAGARVVHLPDVLAVYRMHEGQKTAGVHLPYLPELRQVTAGLRRRWAIP
jgi:ADP-heptose:LPS heptosyltransferase/GT2 family glycosyltransferase